MPTNKVQPISIVLNVKGAEKFSALNRSFRDLSKQAKLSDKDIVQATKDVVAFAEAAGDSEAVIKGQIKAFEGLREQASLGGEVYRKLGRDIARLESNLRGSSNAVEKKRESLVGLAAQSKNNSAALAKVVFGLQRLKGAVREDSAAYRQLNSDIAKVNKTLKEVEVTAAKAKFTLQSALAVRPEKIVPNIKRIQAAIASGTLEAEALTKALKNLELLGVSSGRTIAARRAEAFGEDEGKTYFDRIRKDYNNLEKTSAIISQRISEVNAELANVTGYERRRLLTIELIQLNKELRNAVVEVRTAEEFQALAIRQRMGRARESYAASGFGAFSADVSQRTAAGEFTPGMQKAKERVRLAKQEADEMEKIAELQVTINNLADEYVGSLRSAARTMDEYQQKLGDDILRRYEKETAAQDKAYQNRIANEEDAFRKELERLNTLSQARKAAATAMGIGGREDISSLYQGIIGLSTADIRRQQEMMGKSATEVFNDIATAFEKGGRAVDLKGKSTDIGDDIAEGVVDGASKSSEIAKGAKDFASRLISAYKKAFRIQSPSKETEQKIGVPLGLGIIKGLIAALRSSKSEVKKEIEQILDPGLPRSRSPRSLIGSVNELRATNFGFAYRSRPATPGYRPLDSNVRLDSEIERMFNQFRVNIAALTTDAEIYYNLLQSLPSARLTTNLASAASRRAAAAEIPGFIESQRLIGPGELEREISTAVAQYLRDVRPTDPWVGITADYKRFVDGAVAQSERLRASTVQALPGVRIAGALPPASQDITPAQQQRIERAYQRSSQRSLSVLAEDAFRGLGAPGLPASSFGFMADPARIGRFSGIGRALPPAIDVTATSVDSGSKNLRDSVRNFFDRISQGVRSSFGGMGGGGRGFSGGLGGGGGASGNFERLNAVLQKFGPLSDRSTADIQELGASLRGLGDILSPLDQDFDRVNKAIIDQSNLIDRELEKRERRRGRRRMSPMQMTQAAGAVLSGGIFGGPEGFLGGAIGSLGGVGGAFAGAAIGAQVGGIRRTLGEYADYAAQITRLNIALEGIAGSQAQYNRALQASADVTERLNVPQEVAVQGMTRLVAAVKGAGGGVAEAEVAFKNINAAIIATGGGAEQVQGAVTALVQIFSKGKVSAEEINQIAERLPGTFNKIAEASGRTGPELTKALQQGTVGLNDLMKFLVSLGDEYGELAEKIASSQENAGARLQVAFNQLRIEVGNALKPVGAEFQSAFAEFIKEITPSLVEASRAVGEGLRFVIQNKEAIGVAASFALKLTAVSFALRAFSALNGPVSTMFTLLKSGFKASSQQAALAQGKLLAFGRTVKTLAASLVAPVVITFAVIGAEMVISYFNRIKKARQDLEATAKKPQGEVFFRSIGGTAATKQTLQRNINDIAKNLDILRDRVKSTKEELGGLNEATEVTYGGGGGGLPTQGVASASREDLKARLKADEAEINRLVLNYRTLIDKYLNAPDEPGLKPFADPVLDKDGKGKGKGKKARTSRLDSIRDSGNLLDIEKQILDNAREITQAQADADFARVNQLNNQKISLEFAKRSAENEFEYAEAVRQAANDKDRDAKIAEAALKKEIEDKLLVLQLEAARADEAQRSALAAKERQKALDDEIFGLRDQLGLVTDDQRIARFRAQAQEKYGADDPKVGEAVDLFRQQIDPTFLEGIQQAIRSIRDELETLTDPINQVTGAAAAIGDAFSKSFLDAITGASTAREALASFFRNVGNYFLDLAGSIISKLIEIAVLESVTSVFGGGTSAGGGGILSRLFGFKDGGVVKGIEPFAKGGIVDKPTLFKYASGGTGRFGLMGEAGPEAIMPLRRGRNGKLGVEASAGVGNIIVNVDASDSAAQGDGRQAQQLGKAIGAAVQAELIKQKRPGGLLS